MDEYGQEMMGENQQQYQMQE
jgi:calpain